MKKLGKIVLKGPDKFYEIYTYYRTGKKAYLETKDQERVETAKMQVKDPLVRCIDIECVAVSSEGKIARATVFNYYN